MPDEHSTLVQQATRGDAPAMESLLQRHLPGLRAFLRLRCSREVREKESSSDLAQSVCREVLEGLDGFEYHGEAAFRAWLFAKALSKVQDRVRYYTAQKRDVAREVRPRPRTADDEPSDDRHFSAFYADMITPSRVAMGREEIARIEQAFDELPDDYREVLTLTKVAGLTYQQAGDEMGKSEGAVRGLIERAMTRLTWILSRGMPRDE